MEIETNSRQQKSVMKSDVDLAKNITFIYIHVVFLHWKRDFCKKLLSISLKKNKQLDVFFIDDAWAFFK